MRILQNVAAPTIIDNRPLLDLVQRSKAAQADVVIVEATIAHARRLSGIVGVTHLRVRYEVLKFHHTGAKEVRASITRRAGGRKS
jgi:hypothetical protein